MKLRQRIIKQLMLEYQQNPNSISFAKILKRTDKLLLHIIHSLLATKLHLREISIQELYHEAIIGLSKAVLTIKEEELDRYVPARITAYVKAEIRSTYPYRPKEFPLKEKNTRNLSYLPEVETIDNLLDLEDILLSLTKEEVDLIHKRYFLCIKYKELGRLFHVTPGAVCQRVQFILNKLRKKLK